MECVIFDIDGTLADLTHRRHHVVAMTDPTSEQLMEQV